MLPEHEHYREEPEVEFRLECFRFVLGMLDPRDSEGLVSERLTDNVGAGQAGSKVMGLFR